MIECQMCDSEIDEDEVLYECPYCGEEIEDGVFLCEDCETLLDWTGSEWICPECNNGEEDDDEDDDEMERLVIMDTLCECPSCGAVMYGDSCDECGWPDVNQGWLGETYG